MNNDKPSVTSEESERLAGYHSERTRHQPEYDIVMPFGGKATHVMYQAVKRIEQFCRYRHFYVITDSRSFWRFKYMGLRDLVVINEDSLIPTVTHPSIQDFLYQNGAASFRAGWYLQQFIKMAMSDYRDIADYYLIWDSDTIMLRPMQFFDGARTILARKQEYHPAYFTTYKNLLGLERIAEHSFIAEHMMVQTSIMREIVNRIIENGASTGRWVWRILKEIDKEDLDGSGFSEFETYGNFATTFHPDLVTSRHVASLRDGTQLFGLCPNRYDLHRLSARYDYVTFERRRFNKVRVYLEKIISRIHYELFRDSSSVDQGSLIRE